MKLRTAKKIWKSIWKANKELLPGDTPNYRYAFEQFTKASRRMNQWRKYLTKPKKSYFD